MNSKTNSEYIGFYESVVVNIKDYENDRLISFTMPNDFEVGAELTFGDVINECRKQGYVVGTILLILESYLDGKIYRYGNYNDDKWYEVGIMRGFA